MKALKRIAAIQPRLGAVKKDIGNGIESASEWVSNLEVSNYGVFEKAEMKLTGRPSFVVITGETGAGKSVLVSALEYALSGSNKRNLLLKPGADSKGEGESKESYVSLCLVDHEQKNSLGIKRSRSLSSKRSLCQVNGEKITSKALADQLGGIVKFWSAETSSLVGIGSKASSNPTEGGTFLTHVDNNLDEQGFKVLREIPSAYAEWRKTYLERVRLERLKESADDGNDASLLEFYMEEVDSLEELIREVFTNLLKVLREYEELALDGLPHFGSEEEGAKERREEESLTSDLPSSSTQSLIALVAKTLEGQQSAEDAVITNDSYNYGGITSKVDLDCAWNALRLAEEWAKTLQMATEYSFPDVGSTVGMSSGKSGADMFINSVGLGASSPKRGLASGSEVTDIRDVEGAIENYMDRLITLQEALRNVGLGVLDSGIDSRIEETHVALQASLKGIKTATNMLEGLRNAMPDLKTTVDSITNLRMKWETIRRKHGPGKDGTKTDGGDLAAMRKQWGKDVGSLASLESALPSALSAERNAAKTYTRLAQQLSNARTASADDLLNRVNALLPSLEMSGVQITAIVRPAIESEEATDGDVGEGCSPLLQSVRADGWDNVSLCASYAPAGAFLDQYQPADATDATGAVAALRSTSTLSSGEHARLSLAIESCSVGSLFGRLKNCKERLPARFCSGQETMIVYDEIDAHVGGEAAVAVARLLREQGCKRQVVAITHNPVIAAAANQHFVVSRLEGNHLMPLPSDSNSDDYRSSNGGHDDAEGEKGDATSGSARGSTVVEVRGVDRENELTRMTTGNLDTSAGLELAKVLLEEFQQQ